MSNKIATAFEIKLKEELKILGYHPEITKDFFHVYKRDDTGNLSMLFSIEKKFYYLRIYAGVFLTIDVLNIIYRLLVHYQKMKKKEYIK